MATPPTGNPPGRPRKAAQAAPAVAAVLGGKATAEDAARAAGVGKRTVERYQAAARKGGASKASRPPKGSAAPPPSKEALARRKAVLGALGAALDADPALLAALPIDASELGRRLAGSLVTEGDLDPLAILRRVQGQLEADMRALPLDAVVARKGVATALVQLAKGAEDIQADRPPVGDTPEVIASRLVRERRDAARAKVLEHLEGAERAAAA